MKLHFPKYYRDFACIADKCRHSCCIGWEIDIDEDTAAFYGTLDTGYGVIVKQSIDHTDCPHFRLCEGDRCPHLDEKGLCRIILSLGEEALCEICREHPRFYHDTHRGKEVGIGMACEEACRLILSSDSYAEFDEIEDADATVGELPAFDPLPHRKRIFSMLSNRHIPYPLRLRQIGEAYDISLAMHSDKAWRELLDSLEYLDESHRLQFALFSSDPQTPTALELRLERALAYFLFRHLSTADSEDSLCASLGFCLLCERLLASVAVAQCLDDNAFLELARALSEELEYSEENTDILKNAFLK